MTNPEQDVANRYELAGGDRLTAGAIVLLALLTLVEGFVLMVGVVEGVDEYRAGADDPEMYAAVAVAVFALGGLACVAAGWFRRTWGPRALLIVHAFILVAALLTMNPMSMLYALVPLVLVVLLWRIAERDW